jgi:RNA polymerase sigma-70 factor, ECF subfamily
MSSEAAYFSNALRSTPEILELRRAASEVLESPSSTELDRAFGGDIPVSSISDELLLSQIGEGHREALSLLFRRHARPIRNVAHRILRNQAEADDLVQDVFLTLFKKAAQYDPAQGKAFTWILNITYHRAFDRRRYLNSRHFYSSRDLDETAPHLEDPRKETPFYERSFDGVLGKARMARFRSRLTPEQQETLQLFFFEGYALKEIAERTGRSLVNVRSHYYRGIERLRQYVLPETMRSK